MVRRTPNRAFRTSRAPPTSPPNRPTLGQRPGGGPTRPVGDQKRPTQRPLPPKPRRHSWGHWSVLNSPEGPGPRGLPSAGVTRVSSTLRKLRERTRWEQLGSLEWPQVFGTARHRHPLASWGHCGGPKSPEGSGPRGFPPVGVTRGSSTLPKGPIPAGFRQLESPECPQLSRRARSPRASVSWGHQSVLNSPKAAGKAPLGTVGVTGVSSTLPKDPVPAGFRQLGSLECPQLSRTWYRWVVPDGSRSASRAQPVTAARTAARARRGC